MPLPHSRRPRVTPARCPICRGYGQWNTEIDLVSFRCKRAVCDYCHGAGWIETGDDPVGLPDIVLTPEGYPQWVIRYVPSAEAETSKPSDARLTEK